MAFCNPCAKVFLTEAFPFIGYLKMSIFVAFILISRKMHATVFLSTTVSAVILKDYLH